MPPHGLGTNLNTTKTLFATNIYQRSSWPSPGNLFQAKPLSTAAGTRQDGEISARSCIPPAPTGRGRIEAGSPREGGSELPQLCCKWFNQSKRSVRAFQQGGWGGAWPFVSLCSRLLLMAHLGPGSQKYLIASKAGTENEPCAHNVLATFYCHVCRLSASTAMPTSSQPSIWYLISLYMQGKWVWNCELLTQSTQQKGAEFNQEGFGRML